VIFVQIYKNWISHKICMNMWSLINIWMFSSGNRLWVRQKARGKDIMLGFFLGIWTHSNFLQVHHKSEKMQRRWVPNIPKWKSLWDFQTWNECFKFMGQNLGNKIGPNWPSNIQLKSSWNIHIESGFVIFYLEII
jgi:hypothetical protein